MSEKTTSALFNFANKFISADKLHSVHGTAGRAFIIRIISAGIAFLFQIFLARWLGAEQFGVYIYVWTWVLLLGGIASFGFISTPQRFIPQYKVAKDDQRLRGVIWISRTLPFFIAIIISFLAIMLIMALKPYIDPRYPYPLAIAALCLPAFILTDVQDGIARAYNAIELALLPAYIFRPLLIIVFLFFLNFTCTEGCASNAISSTLLACWVTVVLQYILLKKTVLKKLPIGPRTLESKLWISTSLPIFLMESFYLLLGYTDIIILSKFVNPEHVAQYFAALKILSLVAFVQFSVAAASAHRFSKLYAENNMEGIDKLSQTTTLITFWPSLIGSLILLGAGFHLLKLFGAGFENGYPLMFVLAFGLMARASIGACEKLLVMTGHQIACSKVYAITFGVNLVLCVGLVPFMGEMGAAVALSIAYTYESIALARLAKTTLGANIFKGLIPRFGS